MPMPFPMPVMYDFRPDRQVLIFTTGLSFLTGVIFGLAPALQISRIDLIPALKEGGAIGLGAGRHLSLRNALMISQIAGSLTLLVILGYMSLGIQTTIGIQTGFDPSNLYLISVDPVRDGLSPSQTARFLDALLERVKALPAVASASLTETVPVSLGSQSVEFSAETGSGKARRTALRHVVGSGYFETTGISTLAGRFFRKQEQANAVIVSEELARQIGGEAAAVGRTLQIGATETVPAKVLPGSFDNRAFATEPGSVEIVGVAKDVAESLIVQQRQPVIYFPLTAEAYARPSVEGLTLLTKARPGADVIGAVEHEISALNANVHPFQARSMREHIEHFMSPLRIAAWTYTLIGIFGLVLAAVGLAGLTAYSVATRTREIGIRMALGARKASVLGLIMKEALVLVTLGTIFGMAGAWGGARLLSAMNASVGTVTSTSVSDPLLLTGAPLLLAALTLLACYLPARRSTRIDPVEALRYE
jgi:predicted permease